MCRVLERALSERFAARSEQGGFAVVISENVAPYSEAGAGASAADASSIQVDCDAGSQWLRGGGVAHHEERFEIGEDVPDLVGQEPAIVADAFVVPALGQKEDAVIMKVEEMMKRLMTENLALHCSLVAEKTSHSRALQDKVFLPRDFTKAVEKKKEIARCLYERRNQISSNFIEAFKFLVLWPKLHQIL